MPLQQGPILSDLNVPSTVLVLVKSLFLRSLAALIELSGPGTGAFPGLPGPNRCPPRRFTCLLNMGCTMLLKA